MNNTFVRTVVTSALSLGMLIPTGAASYKVIAAKLDEVNTVPTLTAPSPTPAREIADNSQQNDNDISSSQNTEPEVETETEAVASASPIASVLPSVVPVASTLPIASVKPSSTPTPTPTPSSMPIASIKPTTGKKIELEDDEEDELRLEKTEDHHNEYED